MRRVCNEQQLKILARSKKDILSDTFAKNHGNGAWNIIFGILLGCLIGTAIGVPLAYKAHDMGITVNEKALSAGLSIVFNFLIAMATVVVSKVLKKRGFYKDTAKFFKNREATVNGATIVAIDKREGYFSFIEDDFAERGSSKPYIIDYPLISNKAAGLNVGDRIMVVRTTDGTYMPMKLSEKTRSFVEAYSPVDYSTLELWNLPCIPHPNVDILDKDYRSLSESEKVEFAKIFKRINRTARRGICIALGILIFVILFFTFCIMYADDVITDDTFGICGLGFIGLGILLTTVFSFLIKNAGAKKAKRAEYCKTVMFNYYTADSNGQVEVWVYEYTNGVLGARMYSNPVIEKNLTYGTVLQKYYGKKFECFVRLS